SRGVLRRTRECGLNESLSLSLSHRGDPKLVKVNIAIASGYLINDLVLLLCHWTTIGDGFFLCHHLAALYAYQYVLVSPATASSHPRVVQMVAASAKFIPPTPYHASSSLCNSIPTLASLPPLPPSRHDSRPSFSAA
uniref:TLC domain-containing protein n=1 Tax=Callorhinchus milii TaxID=7868 RepID=A0A4W3GNA8_CALMI